MTATTGAQLLLVGFNALSEAEQEEAFQLIARARGDRQAEAETELGGMLRSLRRAAGRAGRDDDLTVDEYKTAARELADSDEAIEPLSRVLRYFDGSWRRAKEACLYLADEEASEEALVHRLSKRKLGKVWRWRTETLREVLRECCDDHGGRPVRVAEFQWWRQERLRQAAAQGDDTLHLPSPAAYRRVWRSWERALIEGAAFSEDEIKQRLEPHGD